MSSHDSRLRMIASAAAIATAIGVWAWPAKLQAADLGSLFVNPPEQPQPVEFGTGWYLRGDVAYAFDSLPEVDEWGLFPTSSSYRSTYSLDLGGGYKFTNWFRTDLTLDYRQPLTANNPATGTNADGSRWDVLANGYVDLGTWYGVTPYVGAGLGAAWGLTRVNTADPLIPCTQDGTIQCYTSRTSTSLAWALMAGFAFEIFPHAFIDVGYRYLDLGNYSFYNSSLWSSLSGNGLSAAEQSHVHELRVGFRYMID